MTNWFDLAAENLKLRRELRREQDNRRMAYKEWDRLKKENDTLRHCNGRRVDRIENSYRYEKGSRAKLLIFYERVKQREAKLRSENQRLEARANKFATMFEELFIESVFGSKDIS